MAHGALYRDGTAHAVADELRAVNSEPPTIATTSSANRS
jgi:hypothetical protein